MFFSLRQGLGEDRQGKDTGVEGRDEVAQITPNRPIGMAGVDMATPYPFPFAAWTKVEQWGGLRIVNNDKVRFLELWPQAFGIVAVRI